jgi:hypothetical protein
MKKLLIDRTTIIFIVNYKRTDYQKRGAVFLKHNTLIDKIKTNKFPKRRETCAENLNKTQT